MKIKVLMLGPARSVNGGISAVVNNFYEAGLDREVDLTYLGTMEDGSRAHKLWVALRAVILFILIAWKYDIVHINMASDVSIYRKMVFIRIAALYRKKILIHQHGGNIREFYYEQCSDRQRKHISRALNRAEYFLVVAPYLKDIFSHIVDPDKILVLSNSVPMPAEIPRTFEKHRLLFLGRLCKEKGIGELLDAAAALRPDYPDLKLLLGGCWVDRELEEKAEKLGTLIDSPGWIGPAQKEQALADCDIFVLPSYFEGLPVALLEGMSHGCACVATEVGGIPQIIADGKEGLLVPPKDAAALEKALRRLLERPSLQKDLGSAARERINKDYNLEKNMETLLSVYRKMAEKP